MKKILLSLSALLVLAMVFSSCNKNSPKNVAEDWLVSFYHMDYAHAKTLSTEETKKILAIFEQLSVNTPDSDKNQMKKITVQIKNVKEEGDKATVTYVASDNPKEQTIHMVKQNGKWLVQWTKQDKMDEDNSGVGTSNSADDQANSDSTNASSSTATEPPSPADTSSSPGQDK